MTTVDSALFSWEHLWLLYTRSPARLRYELDNPSTPQATPASSEARALLLSIVPSLAPGSDFGIQWEDEGVRLCARLDALQRTPSGYVAAALVPTLDARGGAFRYQAFNEGLHLRAAMAVSGIRATQQTFVESFLLIAHEPEPPYECAAFILDDAALELGARDYRRALDMLRRCNAAQEWPGYSSAGVQTLGLPA